MSSRQRGLKMTRACCRAGSGPTTRAQSTTRSSIQTVTGEQRLCPGDLDSMLAPIFRQDGLIAPLMHSLTALLGSILLKAP